jgi:hypothetical protein
MMHEPEKSDGPIVAAKPANGTGRPGSERVEPRGRPRGTRSTPTRAGRRSGKACPSARAAFGKTRLGVRQLKEALHELSILAARGCPQPRQCRAASALERGRDQVAISSFGAALSRDKAA